MPLLQSRGELDTCDHKRHVAWRSADCDPNSDDRAVGFVCLYRHVHRNQSGSVHAGRIAIRERRASLMSSPSPCFCTTCSYVSMHTALHCNVLGFRANLARVKPSLWVGGVCVFSRFLARSSWLEKRALGTCVSARGTGKVKRTLRMWVFMKVRRILVTRRIQKSCTERAR